MRLKVLERDGWRCVACGDSETTLHVHHLVYSGGLPWLVKSECLQTLCETCHQFLGEHPKAGVWFDATTTGGGKRIVVVDWCPKCGGNEFRDKGAAVKCVSCGWDTGNYCEHGYACTNNIKITSAEPSQKKPKEYSIGWLAGMMTKVRRGFTDEQKLFEILFPFSECKDLFSDLLVSVKEAKSYYELGELDVDREILLLCEIAKARSAIKTKLKGPSHGR